MSDEEEESMSEGFSASEDEWKPTKDVRGGESSDDDDSDFEEQRQAAGAQNNSGTAAAGRRKGTTSKATVKQTAIKKRKSAGQSLRTKLFNKYRPPPKTFPSPNSAGSNSPSASTSRTASKNAKVPNESGEPGNDSSSESSVEDYLVNPEDIDFQSSFFNVQHVDKAKSTSPAPIFDCNAGITKLSDSGSEDNNESSGADEQANGKSFDFANLLDNVNSLERAKETIAKRAAETKEQNTKTTGENVNANAMDVNSLLALGEKQCNTVLRSVKSKDDGEEEDDECEVERAPLKLSKTKSTRVKRHTKTRPASTVVAGDTDDSDFEEVAEDTHSVSHSTTHDSSALLNNSEGLEIHVELPGKQRRNKEKKQQDLELALKRKLNRDLKERFFNLHKTTLLCCFARSYRYNRMLNGTPLMQAALKLLPSSNAYPTERGTEIKYFESLVTWYKTAVKLASPNLYGERVRKSRRRVKRELMAQIKRKEASCKQDFVFIFVVLLRAMGLQCRLIVNMQPLPLRPAATDLLTIKLKREGDKKEEQVAVEAKKAKVESDIASGAEGKKRHLELPEKVSKVKVAKTKENSAKEEHEKDKDKEKVREKRSEKAVKERVTKESERECKDLAKATRDKVVSKNHDNETAQKSTHVGSKKTLSSKLAVLKAEEQSEIKSQVEKLEANLVTQQTTKSAQTKVTKAAETTADDRKLLNNSKEKLATKDVKPKLSRLKSKRNVTEPVERDKLDLSADKPCLSVEATTITQRKRQTAAEKPIVNKPIAVAKSAKPVIQVGSPVIPKIVIQSGKTVITAERENQPQAGGSRTRVTRSRSKSPKMHISPTFLQSTDYRNKFPESTANAKALPKATRAATRARSKSPKQKIIISTDFLQQHGSSVAGGRILRSRQKSNEVAGSDKKLPPVPQLDGADDSLEKSSSSTSKSKRPQLKKLKKKSQSRDVNSDEDFEPSPPKQPKKAPKLPAKKPVDRRVLSSDEEAVGVGTAKRNPTAADVWVEVWSDAEEQWVCIELFKGKLHSVEAIRKAASSTLAYVFAFQNDLSIKDVTARYCPNWTTTVRKSRVERAWVEAAFASYYGQRTARDIREDQELRRIHEEKPMPTSIAEYKDHPLYALERHLLKFQAIYPPEPPTLGFVRGEAVYARECVHTLHSRDIWLKQARTVKLGEQPYKIVKARPKWDRLTQTVIKDQPLEIFGYWQTEDYEPPTAENGIVPRNAYGNVELFKECMLPKKTVHLRLSGLNRICKKLGVDCAHAVIGFDFHQGACHPLYDGFVVCEEFGDQVTAAWYQDQEEQEKKEQDKYEARVYGNWKKLIKGLIIRERLKKKYNF